MLTWQGSERGVYNMQLCGISMVIGPEGNTVSQLQAQCLKIIFIIRTEDKTFHSYHCIII